MPPANERMQLTWLTGCPSRPVSVHRRACERSGFGSPATQLMRAVSLLPPSGVYSRMESPNFDQRAIRKVFEARCPGLHVESVVTLSEQGQFNRLFLINDALVFRCPRYQDGILTLKREAQILAQIRDKVPLRTPRVRWVSSTGAELGEAFLTYDVLPGKPLWPEVLEFEVDAGVRVEIARQLGGFLAALHGIVLWDEARQWPELDGADVWSQMYEEIRERLFAAMRPDARRAVEAHFAEYLRNPSLQEFTPCLRHGDFGSGNVLYDVGERSISGILDFSEAGIGDAAVDLAAVSCFGDDMYAEICAAYPGVEAHLARARFYRGTFALQEALHGLRVGDREAYDSGMESYR